MAKGQLADVLQPIRRLVDNGITADRTDGQLLEALATPQREAAFAVLLRRYGPMVWGLCRRVLPNWLKLAGVVLAAGLVATCVGVLIRPPLAAQPPEAEQRSPSTPAPQEGGSDQPERGKRSSEAEQPSPSTPPAQEKRPDQPEVAKRAFEALAVAFTPDGRMLATASGYRDEGGALILWELTTGRRRMLRTDRYGIRTVAFSPDGRTLAAGGWDKIVRLFEVATGKERAVLRGQEKLPAAQEAWPDRLVNALAFSPDGTLLASASDKTSLKLWDVARGQSLRTLSGHTGRVLGLAFFPDGKTLASTSDDTTMKFWDVNTGKETASFPAHQAGAEGLAISADGKILATGGWDSWVKLWDAATGKERATLQGHTYAVPTVAFSPDGKLLASASGIWDPPATGEVKLWDVAAGKELLTLLTRQTEGIWSVCFSPDGKTLVTAGRDQTLKFWEVATWQERLTLPLNARGAAGRAELEGKEASLSSQQLEVLWDDLASREASKAYRALCTLVRAAPQAVALSRERLRPVVPPDAQQAKRLQQLITDLDSDVFAVRQKATADLARLGELAAPALRKVLAGVSSAEVRQRAERLLGKVTDPASSPARLREWRALEVLEHVGTPEARQVLQTLAKGAPEARLTRDAKASLERLAQRPAAEVP